MAVAALLLLLVVVTVAAVVWPERSAEGRPAPTTQARLVTSAGPPVLGPWGLVAHRGYPSRTVTENTVPAIERAVRRGATAVELDVRLTRDGGLVLLHDLTLERTTTCRGRVDRRLLATIVDRCRGRTGGERVPTLARALDVVRRLGTHVLLDVKGDPGRWNDRRYDRLVAAVVERGLVARTRVLSYHEAHLLAVQERVPDLAVQAIADDLDDVAWMRTWADGLNLRSALVSPALVADLRAQGLLVLGRKAGLAEGWQRLRDAGCDGLLTGRVGDYLRWHAASADGA